MHSSVHAAIGQTAIALSFAYTSTILLPDTAYSVALVFGSVIGFILHDPTDALNEKGYPNDLTALLWEFPLFLFSHSSIFWFEYWEILIYGWWSANGMDAIDKKFYIYYLLKIVKDKFFKYSYTPKLDRWIDRFEPMEIFPCHNQNTLYNFTLTQTKQAAVLSLLVAIAITIILTIFI